MSKKQIITALAVRYADRTIAPHRWWRWARAIKIRAIEQHARNWLSQHGALPEGMHVCRLKERGKDHSFEVDFTRLQRDPGYLRHDAPPSS